ncbi:MAG: hypothetical protein IJ736_12310 [Firmicutes bacterium]|nr:hypothetical protein [Bacillota bacterium]
MSKIFMDSNVSLNENRINVAVPNGNFESNFGNNSVSQLRPIKEPEIKKTENEEEQEQEPKVVVVPMTPKELEEAKAEAEKIIDDARAQALTILSEASAQAQHDRYDELQAGRLEGYEKGYRAAKEEARGILEEANKTLEEAKQQRKELVDELEPQIVDLIMGVIEKVTFGGLKIDPQVMLTIVRQGISGNSGSGETLVYVSEEDYDNVSKNIMSILDSSEKGKNVEICKDANMSRGDCIIHTAFGNIDCSIEPQLKELKEDLYYILENR